MSRAVALLLLLAAGLAGCITAPLDTPPPASTRQPRPTPTRKRQQQQRRGQPSRK
jgi:predicted small lipoprotein YifL